MSYCRILIFQRETDQTHRFSAVVNELKAAETVPHKTAILTFINCIINCTPDLQERNRTRNEFIGEKSLPFCHLLRISTSLFVNCFWFNTFLIIFVGLNLLDVLNFLRKEEVDSDLHLQLQVCPRSHLLS